MFRRPRQPQNPLHFIAHIAETARLAAVAVHREIFAPQRLPHKIRNHPPIVDLHPRPVRIEDSQNSRVQTMIAVIRHRYRFGKALRLVIHRSRSDRIHISPIVFRLRMHQRIPVALRRRCHHEFRAAPQRRFERFKRPIRSHPQSCDSVFGIVHGACRTREVKHII